MYSFVFTQFMRLAELCRTLVTVERSFSGVRTHMISEQARLQVALSTYGAYVRPHIRVYASIVLVQVRVEVERLITQLTNKPLVARVAPFVVDQRLFRFQFTETNVALVGPHIRVTDHVVAERTLVGPRRATELAHVRIDADHFMSHVEFRIGEPGVTLFAWELKVGMLEHVVLEPGPARKRRITILTVERLKEQ